MKRVTWPAPVMIGEESVSPLIVIDTLVLCREEARTKLTVGLAIDIAIKLEKDPIPDFTDEECEFLTRSMMRPNEKFAPPLFNQYVLKVLRALHYAETV